MPTDDFAREYYARTLTRDRAGLSRDLAFAARDLQRIVERVDAGSASAGALRQLSQTFADLLERASALDARTDMTATLDCA